MRKAFGRCELSLDGFLSGPNDLDERILLLNRDGIASTELGRNPCRSRAREVVEHPVSWIGKDLDITRDWLQRLLGGVLLSLAAFVTDFVGNDR